MHHVRADGDVSRRRLASALGERSVQPMDRRKLLGVVVACAVLATAAAEARADDMARALAHVSVVSPKPVQLEMRQRSGGPWLRACDSPCDEDLPIDSEYRIVRGDGTWGDVFRLTASAGEHVRLAVKPPWVAAQIAGNAIIVMAGVVGTIGIGTMAVGAIAVGGGTCVRERGHGAGLPAPRPMKRAARGAPSSAPGWSRRGHWCWCSASSPRWWA
jgi:hypothetical protein